MLIYRYIDIAKLKHKLAHSLFLYQYAQYSIIIYIYFTKCVEEHKVRQTDMTSRWSWYEKITIQDERDVWLLSMAA
jgi:hypothetical protein